MMQALAVLAGIGLLTVLGVAVYAFYSSGSDTDP